MINLYNGSLLKFIYDHENGIDYFDAITKYSKPSKPNELPKNVSLIKSDLDYLIENGYVSHDHDNDVVYYIKGL